MRSTVPSLSFPSHLWHTDEVLDLLARRDIARLFRLIQRHTDITQTQLGLLVGLGQSQISEIISGTRRVSTVEVFARIVTGLGIPEPARSVLFFGDTAATNEVAGARPAQSYADVRAVFATRSEFMSKVPPHQLFDNATTIRAMGLSLNLIVQSYADRSLHKLIVDGGTVSCLLLDPEGAAFATREAEEGYPAGYLRGLSEHNISLLCRLRSRLPAHRRDDLQIAVYDETLRFNIILVEDRVCVAQPYLPHARGIEAPTLLIERSRRAHALYETFEGVFTTVWARRRSI